MKTKELVYIAVVTILTIALILSMIPGLEEYGQWVTSPVALVAGLVFALVFGKTYSYFNKTMSKKLLQYSVVGLGFGMHLMKALESGSEGMLFTVISVFGTLGLGWIIGRRMLKVESQTSYLISSGTAICGGSAIAAVGPVIKAKAEAMSVALGVVFVLNAIALIIFPIIGDAIGMTMKQFGMWAAIAIHDTSSVVGAGGAYDTMHPEMVLSEGVSSQEVATTIKLTRALWIVVLALVTPYFFRGSLQTEGQKKPWYKSVPMFILWFIAAILFNTYVLSNEAVLGSYSETGEMIGSFINKVAKQAITLSLFFIGASLTRETLKAVGIRPLFQGILLWICISVVSLAYILWV